MFDPQNVENWIGGGWKNLVRSPIYSIVQKGHKENPDQVNVDYLRSWSLGDPSGKIIQRMGTKKILLHHVKVVLSRQ